MTVYWFLFGFAALMALVSPRRQPHMPLGPGQTIAILSIWLIYTLIAWARWEVGGDWLTYSDMYTSAKTASLGEAMALTDPLFGLFLWLSAQLGLGIYFVNGMCSAILGFGLVRAAATTDEPWLGILISVPYLLIVVGMGYLRQGAAIGFILMAIASLDRERVIRPLIFLGMAAACHSTSAIVFPIFGYAVSRRYRALAVLLGLVGLAALYGVIVSKFDLFDRGYVQRAYESAGALVRVLMNVVPSLVLLRYWKRFEAEPRARTVWFGVVLANLGLLGVYFISPSSTAVDRIAIYFSIIQMLVFGSIIKLLNVSPRMLLIVRLGGILIAAGVQVVWLVYGVHSEFWVPYKWVFDHL